MQKELNKLISWFEDWETGTQEAREDAERDRDYYDGKQWTTEETAELNRRNQPVVVKNRIFKKINFLLGSEVANRTDPKALPRTPEGDVDSTAMTDALRYFADAERFDSKASLSYEDGLVEGYYGAVVEHELSETEIKICLRYVPWDRLWYDIHSRMPDYSDANHLGLSKWWDLNEAIDNYSNHEDASDNYEEVLEEALTHSNSNLSETHDDRPRTVWSSTQGSRPRVRVSECYWKQDGKWHAAHYTKSGFVVPPHPTGYYDDKGNDCCPLVMASSFVDREGMRYGLVRAMIGAQDEINKRSSKALHWLSVDRVVAEDGAVIDPDASQTERAKPDGWTTVQPGALTNGRIQFEKGLDMAQGQIALLNEAKSDIDSIGPDIPQIGSVAGSSSGRALQVRQQVGALELARVNDNFRAWKHRIYEQAWYRIRQFWPKEKWLRVRDDAERVGYKFVGLNRQMTRGERFAELTKDNVPTEQALQGALGQSWRQVFAEAQQMHAMVMQQNPQAAQQPPEAHEQMVLQMLMQHPIMQEPITANDVSQITIDIVLDESPDAAVVQQEEFDTLSKQVPSIIQARPDMASPMLEMLLEASQLRSKRRILELLRKPPDEAQVQQQQMMQQLQQAQIQAGLQVTQSQAQLNQAKAAQAQVDAQATGAKTQSEIEENEAQAVKLQAEAGKTLAGA